MTRLDFPPWKTYNRNMNARELFLLSPYKYPAQTAMPLGDEDMACWMNAWSALWHPAALWTAAGPPRVEVPYDYDNPQPQHIYAVPEAPPSILPEDWPERVRSAGAVLLPGQPEREETLKRAKEALAAAPLPEDEPEIAETETRMPDASGESLSEALPSSPPPPRSDTPGREVEGEGDVQNASESTTASEAPPALTPAEIREKLLALEPQQVRPFLALGLGYLLQAALSEAMEHENLLETEAFWQDIQQAIAALVGLAPAAAETAAAEPSEPPAGTPAEESDYPPSEAAPPANNSYGYNDYDTNGSRSEYDNYNYGSAPRPRGVADPATLEPWQKHLYSAAQRLRSAREVLYPVTIYLLDVCLLDDTRLAGPWPDSFARDMPLNVIASAQVLEKLQREQPERLAQLKEKIASEQVDVAGGCYQEREDALLPVESQLWNLRHGKAVTEQLLERPLEIFARQRFYASPQLPLFLLSAGLRRAVLVPLDDSGLPSYHSTVVSWPSPDGKQVDAFVRPPRDAHALETLFDLGHFLFKTIREDHSATLAFLHRGEAAAPWYGDFQELYRFGPIFGEWVTLTRYFNDVMSGEHATTPVADEFHYDYLSERTGESERPAAATTPYPVSGFALHQQLRRRVDSCWTLAAMQRGLAGNHDPLRLEPVLTQLENTLEAVGPSFAGPINDLEKQLDGVEQQILQTLADRLLSRATGTEPGYLIVNPCAFKRRIALELAAGAGPLPMQDPIRVCQIDGDKLRLVLEVPALGFAWVPQSGPPDTPTPPLRLRLADDRHVRNEFLEAEIDPQTGGLFSISDRRNPISRLAQRLVFNPGGTMQASSIKATSVGPALGEVIAEGTIVGDQQQVLARFRQRYRAWLGRPILELRIEIYPEQPPAGYPWHAYYGSRFAWREERAMLLRGVNGTSYITNHTRPQTPDFLELRSHRLNTVIFPGGLPFVQRQENRMLDLILVPPGETAQVFDIAIGLDREQPMQTALGLTSPVPIIPTSKGPPHIGATGWLYHLDNPNLLLTGMRPGGKEFPRDYSYETTSHTGDRTDALTVRLLEIAGRHAQAEFRTVRNPSRAILLDVAGNRVLDPAVSSDAIFLDMAGGDFCQLQVEFS